MIKRKNKIINQKNILNETCPICLELDNNMHIMTCGHQLHLDCAIGMINTQCPLCRCKNKNFPRYILNTIKDNESKSIIEQTREQNRNIQHYIDRENAIAYIQAINFYIHNDDLINNAIIRVINRNLNCDNSLVDEMIQEIIKDYENDLNNGKVSLLDLNSLLIYSTAADFIINFL